MRKIGIVELEAAMAVARRRSFRAASSDLGVSPTALSQTIAGLAPRPMAELAVLMKSAYGHDIGPNWPYPGLEVIAQALNQGDIGRAMVAAVQLRLPDLDEEGAA